ARVGEEGLPLGTGEGARRQLGQLLAQRAVARVVKVGAADVDQDLCLFGDGRADRGVAVTGRRGRHAGLAVEVDVAVEVLDHAAAGAPYGQRVAVDQRGRQEGALARDHRARQQAGWWGDDGDRLRGQRLQRLRLARG